MSDRYFLNELAVFSSCLYSITGITFVFTFHMCYISVVRLLYFRIFSAFVITFLSPEIAAFISTHFPSSLSWIIMSGLSLEMVLSVCTC